MFYWLSRTYNPWIIASDTLNFMYKAKGFPSLWLLSFKKTISDKVININMVNQSDPAFLGWLAE